MCSKDRLGWYSRSTARSLLCGQPVRKEPMSDPMGTSDRPQWYRSVRYRIYCKNELIGAQILLMSEVSLVILVIILSCCKRGEHHTVSINDVLYLGAQYYEPVYSV